VLQPAQGVSQVLVVESQYFYYARMPPGVL
jgi:hypothetical protein